MHQLQINQKKLRHTRRQLAKMALSSNAMRVVFLLAMMACAAHAGKPAPKEKEKDKEKN